MTLSSTLPETSEESDSVPLSARWSGRVARGLIVPAVFVLVWQIACVIGWAPSSSIPSPATVLESWYTWIFGPPLPLAWYSGTWGLYVLLVFAVSWRAS